MIWNEIICLGDSLTYGARDEYLRSYPAELAAILRRRTGEFWYCHNYGVNGDTTSDVQRRCWRVFSSHRNVRVAMVLIGSNDIKVPIPEDIFRDNLEQILLSAQVHNILVFLGTLPPVHFHPSHMRNRDYLARYSDIICQTAAKMDLPLCDFSGLGGYLIDGLHLSHEGYVAMAEIWAKALLSGQVRCAGQVSEKNEHFAS